MKAVKSGFTKPQKKLTVAQYHDAMGHGAAPNTYIQNLDNFQRIIGELELVLRLSDSIANSHCAFTAKNIPCCSRHQEIYLHFEYHSHTRAQPITKHNVRVLRAGEVRTHLCSPQALQKHWSGKQGTNAASRQNNSRLDELASKVSALRGVTVDIYDNARNQEVIDSSVCASTPLGINNISNEVLLLLRSEDLCH